MARFRIRAATPAGKPLPSQPASPRRPAADDWLQSVPIPEAQEGGDSMWQAWHDEARRMDEAFADTQPSDAVPLADTAPPQATHAPRVAGRWNVDDLVAMARRNNRVCPRPLLWSALHELLEGDHYADLQPPPVHPWKWSKLSSLQRRLQFREYIAWADRHHKLEQVGRYLQSLAEPDWVHMGEE